MKILPLRIENGRLILDGVRLTGVEGYTIKISSELPLSLIHIPSPRDKRQSRMPSSA